MNYIDDSIVLDKFKPLHKDGCRQPIYPRTYFRMHYLYFTLPEIMSFRQLCDQLLLWGEPGFDRMFLEFLFVHKWFYKLYEKE